jgi:hypothetical protein
MKKTEKYQGYRNCRLNALETGIYGMDGISGTVPKIPF